MSREGTLRIWFLAPLVVIAIVFTVYAVTLSNTMRDNTDKINQQAKFNQNVLCLQVAKLSHTPSVAEMLAVGCDPKLLPPQDSTDGTPVPVTDVPKH